MKYACGNCYATLPAVPPKCAVCGVYYCPACLKHLLRPGRCAWPTPATPP